MCAAMKERRYRPGAAVVDGKIYVLGGEEGWDRWATYDDIKKKNQMQLFRVYRYCNANDFFHVDITTL